MSECKKKTCDESIAGWKHGHCVLCQKRPCTVYFGDQIDTNSCYKKHDPSMKKIPYMQRVVEIKAKYSKPKHAKAFTNERVRCIVCDQIVVKKLLRKHLMYKHDYATVDLFNVEDKYNRII